VVETVPLSPTAGNLAVIRDPQATHRAAQLAAQWADLPQLQRNDAWTGPIVRYLTDKTLPEDDAAARALLLTIDQYALDNGMLLKSPQKHRQICLPRVLRPFVLQQVHSAPAAGHLGNKKTYQRMIRDYYWPKCYEECSRFVKECRTCALSKPPPRNHRQEMGQRRRPQNVWQVVHMDIWVPGGRRPQPTARGNTNLLALVDAASKFVVLRTLPNHTKEVLVDTLANDIFPQYGVPLELVSDRGGGFISQLQAAMLTMFGVTRQLVLPHHPRANGQVERFFRVFRSMLSAIMVNLPERYQNRWDEYVQHAAYAYNTSVHRSTGATPYFLFHGHHPETILHDPPPPEVPNEDDTEAQEWLEALATARQKALEAMQEEEAKNRRRFNLRANPQAYQPGDPVFLRNRISPGELNPKLRAQYTGPYTVVRVDDHRVTIVPLGQPNAQEIEVHIDKLRQCFTRFIGPPEEDAPHRGPGRPRRNRRRRSRTPSPELGGAPHGSGGTDDRGYVSEGEEPRLESPVRGEENARETVQNYSDSETDEDAPGPSNA
jgi:transposase InsO family protein